MTANQDQLLDPSIVISVLALLFTIFSFWWIHARRGRLQVSPPRSFATLGSQEAKLVLELPLLFFNTGPQPIVIDNLRLTFLEEKPASPLNFVATLATLGKDDGREFATQFPVRGREAFVKVCEFQRDPGKLTFEVRQYPMSLEARVNGSKKWTAILDFDLTVSERGAKIINKNFVVHDNALES